MSGSIAKWLHPGEDPVGIVNTIIVGISGSINWRDNQLFCEWCI